MSKEIEILTKQIIKHYGIDVPVMATRVVGKTLELYLYGGRVLRVPIEGEEPAPVPEKPAADTLSKNLRARLRKARGKVKP